jgi:hypothetical protein
MSLVDLNRDVELLIGLTHRYRCISAPIAEMYFVPKRSANAAYAAKWLRRLELAGLLKSEVVYAKQLPHLTHPLASWSAGQGLPEFGQLSHVLRTRFRLPARSTRIYVAARAAAIRYGGSCERWPRRSETTHDLGLAQVCLELMTRETGLTGKWISEGLIVSRGTTRGQKVPDALIHEPNGKQTVIEFGGEYGKQKLAAFHTDCVRRNRSYEIW